MNRQQLWTVTPIAHHRVVQLWQNLWQVLKSEWTLELQLVVVVVQLEQVLESDWILKQLEQICVFCGEDIEQNRQIHCSLLQWSDDKAEQIF